jgi:type 1 glutamine amidotransferase
MKLNTSSLLRTGVAGLLLAGIVAAAGAADGPKKLLVVSVTTGFRHSEGIDASEKVLPKLVQQTGGTIAFDHCRQPARKSNPPKKPTAPKPDAGEAAQQKFAEEMARWEADNARFKLEDRDYQARLKQELEKLSPANLKNYDGVIFNNTTGDLPLPDREGFLEWIRNGGAFIGIHAATDTYPGFPGYLEMVGGQFAGHGAQSTVDIINQDPQHPACKMLPATWTVHDEIYLLKKFDRQAVHGLLTLDKHPNNRTPGDFPIAYCKLYGKGRVFYTSLGHRADVWDDEAGGKRMNSPEVARLYQQHLLGGIKWAVGLAPGDATPQAK